jgi:hypothetical protein
MRDRSGEHILIDLNIKKSLVKSMFWKPLLHLPFERGERIVNSISFCPARIPSFEKVAQGGYLFRKRENI